MRQDRERRRRTRRDAETDFRFADGQASLDACTTLIGPDGKVIDWRSDPPPAPPTPPPQRPKREKRK